MIMSSLFSARSSVLMGDTVRDVSNIAAVRTGRAVTPWMEGEPSLSLMISSWPPCAGARVPRAGEGPGVTREPAPGQSCMARTVASSADVTPTTRRCEYYEYEYRVTMPRSRPTNTHCSPILAPLSSRPPNNNIISIENKVSSRNFTSCLATLGHGDGTSYKNNFDFHSYSSEKRFRDDEYLFFNQFSSWFEGNFWSYF